MMMEVNNHPSAGVGGGGGGGITENGVNGGVAVQQQQPRARMMKKSSKEEVKLPQWQLDLIMEKLRQKSNQLKPLVETSKNIRQALMERRCIIDQGDKLSLQKSLDTLQQSIRVNSLQSMVERLEMVARQLGLKFTPGATGHEWFIHSDMFYLELLIDAVGAVEDVKIQHEGKTEQQSCPEIVESLKKTDFQDFTAHLEGLVSIYHLNADKKIKSKAYIALQSLETDLANIWATYSHVTEADLAVMKTLLGVFQPRKGGHAVKLIYFVSPYEFLDVNTKSSLNNDVKTVLSHKLGNAVTIHIQASASHKLQMCPTVNITRTPEGKSIPRYGSLNATNSTALPACFVLKLDKPVPMCVDLIKSIHATTEIESCDLTYSQPILNLITHQLSGGAMNCLEKGLFVTLPDQVHCYFMTENPYLQGVMVSSISFTMASQLPQVISVLRQQMAFNTLVGSCIRAGSKPELDHIVFEVNALSHQKLSVSFQHPLDDSLVTLEFDLKDVTHPHCQLHAVANATEIIPTLEELACKVAKRSMSIPITLRAVIRRWQSMKAKQEPPDFSVAVGSSGMNMDVSRVNDRSCGAESAERRSHSSHQSMMVPPGIMNFSNNYQAGNTMKPPSSAPPYGFGMSSMGFSSQAPQSPMDILSLMNPFLGLTNQVGIGSTSSFPNIPPNIAVQMLASQMNPSSSAAPSPMLMGLLDQVGQTQKRRKRKNTADSLPSPSPKASLQSRPNQSPSRTQKSPVRRQSDNSDGDKASMNALMSELGMDQQSDSRWNVDITPILTGSESLDDLDSFRKHANRKIPPKRSMSLDSHSSEDIAGIQNLIDGQDFKPMMNSGLSITPVSTSSNSNVNSLLASIRPGIEIIPLSAPPVSIPSSLTVTPVPNKNNSGDNKDKPKKPKDRNVATKRKMDAGEGEGKPSKLPFFDRSKLPPGLNLMKRASSPSVLGLISPSKPMPASQGKPSVSAMKSASSPNSPKGGDVILKQKPKKPGTKSLKGTATIGNIPPLRALSPITGTPTIKVEGQAAESSKLEAKPTFQQNMPNFSAAVQQAAVNSTASCGQKTQKKGLAAVIDKLKSVHSSAEIVGVGNNGERKDAPNTMSAKDYLKASSAMNDVLQQKKALATGSTPPGQEYMVKGAQGLKLTINKAKLKDPSKSPKAGIGTIKSPVGGVKKPVMGIKPLTALSAKLASATKKAQSPASKDSKDGQKAPVMKSKDVKSPRPDSEDLAKKMFLPVSVRSLESGTFSTAPRFDSSSFQIPKKPRSHNNGSNSGSSENGSSKTTSGENGGTSKAGSVTAADLSMPKEKSTISTSASSSQEKAENEQMPMDLATGSSNTVSQRSEVSDSTPPVTNKESTSPVQELESQSEVKALQQQGTASVVPPEYTSPESPDPVNLVVNAGTPQTIPTTPVNSTMMNEESPKAAATPSSTTPTRTEIPPPLSSSSIASVAPTNPKPKPVEVEEVDDSSGLVIDEGGDNPSASSDQQETCAVSENKSEEKGKSQEMPPPPAPTDTPISPSPAASVPSPKPVASPLSVSIAIVHSPKPTSPSPAMLKSPLVVVASPAGPAASPYPIDDDLMDEALIGGNSK